MPPSPFARANQDLKGLVAPPTSVAAIGKPALLPRHGAAGGRAGGCWDESHHLARGLRPSGNARREATFKDKGSVPTGQISSRLRLSGYYIPLQVERPGARLPCSWPIRFARLGCGEDCRFSSSRENCPMLRVGLTGGLGSGKSTVAGMFPRQECMSSGGPDWQGVDAAWPTCLRSDSVPLPSISRCAAANPRRRSDGSQRAGPLCVLDEPAARTKPHCASSGHRRAGLVGWKPYLVWIQQRLRW